MPEIQHPSARSIPFSVYLARLAEDGAMLQVSDVGKRVLFHGFCAAPLATRDYMLKCQESIPMEWRSLGHILFFVGSGEVYFMKFSDDEERWVGGQFAGGGSVLPRTSLLAVLSVG